MFLILLAATLLDFSVTSFVNLGGRKGSQLYIFLAMAEVSELHFKEVNYKVRTSRAAASLK